MAPSTVPHEQTSPLLLPKPANDQPTTTTQLSHPTTTAIKTLAILRLGIGAASLITPRWACALFQYSLPQGSSIIGRLFGIREVILGELLYTSEDKNAIDGGRREVRRALWCNIAADTVDICSVGFAVATGGMGRVPGALFAGGAVVGVGLGALCLKEV
ncbi:hypothetical protein K458DRAFT_483510 [Lentithecium fluviatile CBS 122367]|uniref:Uncharacterized protein n=1 Tax=Lentithecium fluviatile CBS 122367 TaxID=1168545 RepID=A0A6G1JHG6_9PLEO|nr:hypothetical protein K458DRAFT_483510 [Lentithecium fluviatile CBS 122367]